MQILKYQSLKNKFVLLDQRNNPVTIVSPSHAQKICAEHSVDGVLILYQNKNTPEITMFNSDGSDGQLCLNGARCVAHYLHTKHNFPTKFDLLIGNKIITNKIDGNSITQQIPLGSYLGTKKITCKAGEFSGHIIDVGNPHFIIFQKQHLVWLTKNGYLIEQHPVFPNKTNVEFIWKTGQSEYTVLNYERGCGITQACSSGAAAITQLLLLHLHEPSDQYQIEPQKIQICMRGGTVISWLTNNQIALYATVS